MIGILDTGGANLASIQNAFLRLGRDSKVTSDPKEIEDMSHVILPGVGNAGYAMEKLEKSGLAQKIPELKVPVLGICLGMQLLFSSSEEGDVDCLGLLPGSVSKMKPTADFRIPHMGWNQLRRTSSQADFLFDGIASDAYFYFVHSFAGAAGDWVSHETLAPGPIPAVVAKNNFYGVQFHPERSGAAGAQLLRNFIAKERV